MSEAEPTREGNRPKGHDQFTVADMANENAKFFNSRSDADDRLEKAQEAPGVEPKLFPPGESPEWLYHGERPDSTDEIVVDGDESEMPDKGEGRAPELDDRGKPQMPEVEPITENDMTDLPERNVSDDPLTWMPQHFVDQIDGTPAINRKGFEVLAHHYNISTTSELEVPPEETGHEYVRVKARAVTEDGRECEAYGSAYVDRGDDKSLLLEMADTRARKRALSVATGVGTIAVEELRNEVDK